MKIQCKVSLLAFSILLLSPLVTLASPPVNTIPTAVTALEDIDSSLKGITVKDIDGNLVSVELSVAHGKLTVTSAAGNGLIVKGNNSPTLKITGPADKDTEGKINSALSSLMFKGNLNYIGADFLKITSTDASTPTAKFSQDQVSIMVNRPSILGPCTSYKKQSNEGEHIGDLFKRVSVGSVINYSVVNYNIADKRAALNAQAFGFGVAFRYYTPGQLNQAGKHVNDIAEIPLACRATTTDLLNFSQAPAGQLAKIGSTISVSPTFYVFKNKDDSNLGTQLALNFGFLNDFLTIGVGWNLSGKDAGEWFVLAGPSLGFQF